ncbi:MAG TPA: hypothetical protein VNH44_16605 [Micropepsaceae bacterium]|nr:hypothetical protein [Micropepsaceae bacterium]
MSNSTLQSAHAETRDIVALDARILSSVIIAVAGILSFVPFAAYLTQH